VGLENLKLKWPEKGEEANKESLGPRGAIGRKNLKA
jgi:hypothetical protein